MISVKCVFQKQSARRVRSQVEGGLFQKVNSGSSKIAGRTLGNNELTDIHYPEELFHYKKETKIQTILYFLG